MTETQWAAQRATVEAAPNVGADQRAEVQKEYTSKSAEGGNSPEITRRAFDAFRRSLPPELQGKLQSAYETIVSQALSGDPSLASLLNPIHTINSAELMAKLLEPPVWIVPDLLPIGLTILAGRPKVGKSWLALQICQAVCTGGQFFGKGLERGRVLYLALEDHERRLQSRMNLQGWPPNAGGAEFILADTFREQITHLNSGGGLRLAQKIRADGYRLVVVDTLSRALKGDQKDESDMTAATAPLQETALALNIGIVLIDHHKKPMGAADPNPIDDILGSTAKGAVADAAWGLYKEQGKRGAKLAITGRDVDEVTLKVVFDPVTRCWQCEGEAGVIEHTQRREDILAALKLLPRAQVGEIAEAVGQPKSNTFSRLQDLINAGLVLRIAEGTKVYYALPETQTPLAL